MITAVTKNQIIIFFAIEPNIDVIKDFSESLTFISLLVEKIINKDGNKKVTLIETIKPNVIIQPKSIIGFMPLKIKDKKAQIVVKTV